MSQLLLALLLSLDLTSYRQAAALIDGAVAARGVALTPIAFGVDVTVRQLHQSPLPSEPYLETKLAQTIVADPATRTFVIDETTIWPEFTSRTTSRISRHELTTIRHNSATHSRTSDGIDASARVVRRHPDLLLAAALRRRASLRLDGAGRVRIALDDGGVMTATFKETKLMTIGWIAYHELFGDMEHRIDYEWSGSDPIGFRQFENGRLSMIARYRETRRGVQVTMPGTTIPAESRLTTPPPTVTPQIEELAPDVFLVRNAGGADYHSLLVRFRDRLVVVEAPRSPALARAAIAAIRSWDPQRPIEQIVITHHHDDHIGGVRGYAETGARMITTPGNVTMIRALLDAPHTIQPAPAVKGEVAGVRSGTKIHDDTNELVLLIPEANDHVSESVVAWLPRQQIVFQGDLFRHDPDVPEPARNAAVALSDFIAKQGLPVKTIAGVHGEPASMDDLRAAIARRGSPR